MTDDEEISRIMQSVERAYGSWETPDYLFAQRALDSAEWEGLVEKLRAYADLGETTDFNSEVCRSFVIRKEGKDMATLQLSFVGPYGVFFRYEGPPDDIFIAGPDQARSELEAAIARTCAENGVRLLAKRILEVPLRLRLFDTDPDRVRVYQALFTDIDYLPGEYEAQRG